MAMAKSSYATPIVVTQTFSNVRYDNYGVVDGVAYGQSPTGDWIFKGIVDSNAVDAEPHPNVGIYQLTGLTLTQASLGLFDVEITNAPKMVFGLDRFYFGADSGGSPPWTVIVFDPDHFATGFDLSGYLALLTRPIINDSYTSFGPQWTGFNLADGRHLYGWGFGTGVPSVAFIPEPASVLILLIGLCVSGFHRIR